MTKKEKVAFVINELKKLYPKIPIPLEHDDSYTLLIAVLMSAQSTDVRVCLLYTSPSPRDRTRSRMPSSA